MAINDFSAVIQLMATISIAFVAVEYVKSFTGQLCDRVFRFKDFIKQSFQECKNSLADKETLDSLEPLIIEGKSTFATIEEVKRKHETLITKVDSECNLKINRLKDVCQVRSMPALCLYVFMACALILFLGGFEKAYTEFVRIMGTIYIMLSLIYLFCGWSFGESLKPFFKFCYFPSLRHTIIGFVIISVLSLIVACLLYYFNLQCLCSVTVWCVILPLFLLFVYANYVVFVVKIWKKAQQFRGDINEAKELLKEECCSVKNEVDDLVATKRVNSKLIAD